jgi:hypothetical protein
LEPVIVTLIHYAQLKVLDAAFAIKVRLFLVSYVFFFNHIRWSRLQPTRELLIYPTNSAKQGAFSLFLPTLFQTRYPSLCFVPLFRIINTRGNPVALPISTCITA